MYKFLHTVIHGIWIMTFLQSCNPPIRNRVELQTYIDNPAHGLTDTLKRSSVLTKLVFQPWQLIAMKSIKHKRDAIADSSQFSKNLYFVLSLSKDGRELLKQLPFEQYSEMIQVLSFRMQDFISVRADDNADVSPVECMFQQTYGMTESNMLLLVFEKSKIAECKKLNFFVKEFGLGLGELTFQLKNDEINRVEELNYLTIL